LTVFADFFTEFSVAFGDLFIDTSSFGDVHKANKVASFVTTGYFLFQVDKNIGLIYKI
jgi:hypothetical protein